MKKVLVLVLVLAMVSALLIACTAEPAAEASSEAPSSEAPVETTEPSEAPSESEPAETSEAPSEPATTDDEGATDGAATEPNKVVPASQDYNLVGLWWSRGFEFMVALDQGCRDEVEALGASIEILDGNSDSSLQVTQIEDNIAKGVDGIILAPNNTEDLVVGVKKANEANVPVVTVDALVNMEKCDVVSAVSFDNYKAGGMVGKAIVSMFPDGGTVLECTGDLTFGHAQARSNGFQDAVKAAGNFEIIQKDAKWSAENAQNAAIDNLNANPDLLGVFCANEEMLGGVAAGLKQIGKMVPVGEEGHVALFGVDGTPNGLQLIREGSADAVIEQNAFNMGKYAADCMIAYLEGETPEEIILVQPIFVDINNVDDPTLWGNIWDASNRS